MLRDLCWRSFMPWTGEKGLADMSYERSMADYRRFLLSLHRLRRNFARTLGSLTSWEVQRYGVFCAEKR